MTEKKEYVPNPEHRVQDFYDLLVGDNGNGILTRTNEFKQQPPTNSSSCSFLYITPKGSTTTVTVGRNNIIYLTAKTQEDLAQAARTLEDLCKKQGVQIADQELVERYWETLDL